MMALSAADRRSFAACSRLAIGNPPTDQFSRLRTPKAIETVSTHQINLLKKLAFTRNDVLHRECA